MVSLRLATDVPRLIGAPKTILRSTTINNNDAWVMNDASAAVGTST